MRRAHTRTSGSHVGQITAGAKAPGDRHQPDRHWRLNLAVVLKFLQAIGLPVNLLVGVSAKCRYDPRPRITCRTHRAALDIGPSRRNQVHVTVEDGLALGFTCLDAHVEALEGRVSGR